MTAKNVIRLDLHNHTHYSRDSILTPRQFVERARRRGMDCVALTDHNTIRGAAAVQRIAGDNGVRVIVGEEIRTAEGEVLALFLTEEVPRGLSPEETIDRVKAQGGLVGVPHPFDYLRSALRPEAMTRLIDRIDFIEALNARMVFASHNGRALALAQARRLPMSAGSDAHSRWEVGSAYVEMPDFTGPGDFLERLRSGKLVGRLSSPLIHLFSRYAAVRARLGWRPR